MISHKKDKIPRRGIQLLPSVLTTGNIFCGFYAISAMFNHDPDTAAKAIGIAIILDGVDGRLARIIGATSEFGLQLDSLADAISFGLAPAVLLWGWHLNALNYLGWIACFIYLICGIMRLARFNIQEPELKHFVGLPIPAAAGMIAAIVHFSVKYTKWPIFTSFIFPYIIVLLAIFLGMAMISTLRYPSFKSLSLKRGKSHFYILESAIIIACIWFFSYEFLVIIALLYFFSGIFITTKRRFSFSKAKNL